MFQTKFGPPPDVPTEQERLTVGDRIFCAECGLPREKTAFDDSSTICRNCMPVYAQRLKMAEARVKDTVGFNGTLKKLKQQSTPLVPGGVQKMNEALKGKSVYEFVAETFLEVRGDHLSEAERKSLPRDFKSEVSLLRLMHDANKSHDDALTDKNPAAGLDNQELESIMLDAALEQLVSNKSFRLRIFRALYQHVPDLIGELLEASGTSVIECSGESL